MQASYKTPSPARLQTRLANKTFLLPLLKIEMPGHAGLQLAWWSALQGSGSQDASALVLNPTGTTLYVVGGAWSPNPITFVQNGGAITAVEVRLPMQA